MDKRVGYLQDLCNRFGDFKVTKTFKNKDKDIIWTKHHSVLELWHSDYGLRYLEGVNHRQILPNELILDLDEVGTLHNVKRICFSLRHKGIGNRIEVYSTSSKGYHIHVWDNNWALMSRHKREELRENLIYQYGCDLMKKYDKCMIALESVPHFKSGKIKRLLKEEEYQYENT